MPSATREKVLPVSEEADNILLVHVQDQGELLVILTYLVIVVPQNIVSQILNLATVKPSIHRFVNARFSPESRKTLANTRNDVLMVFTLKRKRCSEVRQVISNCPFLSWWFVGTSWSVHSDNQDLPTC
jgi:hypothetical protein